MATRFIEQGIGVEGPGGHIAGFGVEAAGALAINRGPDFKGVLSSDPGAEPIPVGRVAVLTASATATAADNGAVFIANATSSVVVQLPATRAGLRFSLVVQGLTTSGGHAFSPVAADKIMGTGYAKADDADLVCSAATDALGNFVTIVADGVDGWWILGKDGTWA